MQITITNDKEHPIFVTGTMIPAGESRTFEDWQVPPEHRPAITAAEQAVADTPLQAIAALSVPKLEAGLPALSDDELTELEALENAKDKPRQGALAAIIAERLRRAEASAAGGLPPDGQGQNEGQNNGQNNGQNGNEGQGQ